MNRPLLTCWIALGFIFVAWAGFQVLQSEVPWKADGPAAWVQAFGSIAAIMGAGVVAAFQIREARRAQTSARVDALVDQLQQLEGVWHSAQALIASASSVLSPIHDAAWDPDERERWKGDPEGIVTPLVQAQEALQNFPSYLLGNARAVLELGHAQSSLRHAIMALREYEFVADPRSNYERGRIEAFIGQMMENCLESLSDLEDEWRSVRCRFDERIEAAGKY